MFKSIAIWTLDDCRLDEPLGLRLSLICAISWCSSSRFNRPHHESLLIITSSHPGEYTTWERGIRNTKRLIKWMKERTNDNLEHFKRKKCFTNTKRDNLNPTGMRQRSPTVLSRLKMITVNSGQIYLLAEEKPASYWSDLTDVVVMLWVCWW